MKKLSSFSKETGLERTPAELAVFSPGNRAVGGHGDMEVPCLPMEALNACHYPHVGRGERHRKNGYQQALLLASGFRFYHVTLPLTPALSRGRGRMVLRRSCKSGFIHGRKAIGQSQTQNYFVGNHK